MFKKFSIKQMDGWLIVLMMLLTGIGILAISSATASFGDEDLVKKQLVFFGIGFVLMLIVMSIDYHMLGDWYLIIYVLTNLVLLSVFFLGKEVNGAARWISIGGFQLQPSEFAKIAMILCCAKLIDKYNKKINRLWPILVIGAFDFVPFILINRQPNLSTSIVLVVILMIQLFVTKLDFKYIASAVGIGILIVTVAFVYIVKNPDQKLIAKYQRDRIVNKIHGGDSLDERYQTTQAIHAIGSGGLKGKGLYQGSISQLNYLPESQNDFIIAVIGEEFGFIGATGVIALLMLFILRGLWIARGAPDDLGKFIVVGYIGMIAMQSFVNIGVATDLLPNTGIPVPFISYGGSSLWANMIGMGLVLNVAMTKEETMF
ncbi:cell division protein [Sporanaerobium hydrogeniformans]|uniref:Cell division protein n=1 Tax=Sporanaerobium hydrogeniformans TaxID=3072179 RepID=A0AC61DF96_9FIRM|nr:FtsW/RodA/SpoVE family cell cycle protein [Sporanaerobium hydrogeniformans]PHV71488.1 cell division protein [Sporanaerobium hydrogeniformans]